MSGTCSVMRRPQTDWTQHLAPLEFAYNTAWHPSTKMAPFGLDLGYHSGNSMLLQDSPDVASVIEFTEHPEALQSITVAHIKSARQVHAQAVNACRPRPTMFQAGDQVLLITRYLRPPFMTLKQTENKELCVKFIGTFAIIRKIGSTSYELNLRANTKVYSVIYIDTCENVRSKLGTLWQSWHSDACYC